MVNFADDFSDADLRRILRRSLIFIAILTLITAPLVWLHWGWRNAVLLIVGAVVSATGIWEWQRLLTVLIAKLDAASDGGSTPSAGRASAMFFLRLVVAAAVIYVSLRCCNGSVYALLGGLAFSLLAFAFEGTKLLLKG